LLTIIDDLVFH